MKLSEITKIQGNKSKAKRRARGIGSGKGGHTMGKGMKGQKSRAGKGMPFGFEGGQVPLYKKLPEFGGFKNHNAKRITSVPLNVFSALKDGSEVTPEILVKEGIIPSVPKHGVKVLNSGKVEKKLKLSGFSYSAGAREALEKAGCTLS